MYMCNIIYNIYDEKSIKWFFLYVKHAGRTYRAPLHISFCKHQAFYKCLTNYLSLFYIEIFRKSITKGWNVNLSIKIAKKLTHLSFKTITADLYI